jgi:8-amino-7-oxononanoate synthase
MNSLDDFASAKLSDLESRSLRRTLAVTDPIDAVRVERDGRTLISFCSNDYLNLSQDTRVKARAAEALERYGVGSGASRLVTGNHPLFGELEARLARLKGTDDAAVFGSGYLANLGIVPSLVGEGDVILADELCHACLLAGTRLSGAEAHLYRHNDLEHLETLLRTHGAAGGRRLILTDGVFSMDGDLAPLSEMQALAEAHDAWLLSDDAHGIGVLGGGRGSAHAHGNHTPPPLQMGTLSKAIGSYGGYLCASQPVIDLMKTRARTLIYSTGLPAASVAASLAALDIIEEDPVFCRRPVENARRFAGALGLAEPESPIVPLILGDAEAALATSKLLFDEGFLVSAIRPPTVPDGTARLRFTFTAAHDAATIDRLVAAVTKVIPEGSALPR